MSPGRFLAEHTSYEISEWMAWHKLEEVDRKTADGEGSEQGQGRRRGRGGNTRLEVGDSGNGKRFWFATNANFHRPYSPDVPETGWLARKGMSTTGHTRI